MATDPKARQREHTTTLRMLAQQQQIETDTRWLMSDPRGRRLMWGWLEQFGIFRTSWTGQASSTDFREGERNAAIKLQAQVMAHCPEQFLAMLAEANAPSGAHKAEDRS